MVLLHYQGLCLIPPFIHSLQYALLEPGQEAPSSSHVLPNTLKQEIKPYLPNLSKHHVNHSRHAICRNTFRTRQIKQEEEVEIFYFKRISAPGEIPLNTKAYRRQTCFAPNFAKLNELFSLWLSLASFAKGGGGMNEIVGGGK